MTCDLAVSCYGNSSHKVVIRGHFQRMAPSNWDAGLVRRWLSLSRRVCFAAARLVPKSRATEAHRPDLRPCNWTRHLDDGSAS